METVLMPKDVAEAVLFAAIQPKHTRTDVHDRDPRGHRTSLTIITLTLIVGQRRGWQTRRRDLLGGFT